jgi:hypothetical protein
MFLAVLENVVLSPARISYIVRRETDVMSDDRLVALHAARLLQ